jgi:hypothetical protein
LSKKNAAAPKIAAPPTPPTTPPIIDFWVVLRPPAESVGAGVAVLEEAIELLEKRSVEVGTNDVVSGMLVKLEKLLLVGTEKESVVVLKISVVVVGVSVGVSVVVSVVVVVNVGVSVIVVVGVSVVVKVDVSVVEPESVVVSVADGVNGVY